MLIWKEKGVVQNVQLKRGYFSTNLRLESFVMIWSLGQNGMPLKVMFHHVTRYTHAHQVPHAEHMESLKWRSSKRVRDDAVLSSAYPFTSQRAK